MNMKLRNIPFSPPDMSEAEANEVRDAILSGWITTGPRTKKLEKRIAEYVEVEKTVCLNSATNFYAHKFTCNIFMIRNVDNFVITSSACNNSSFFASVFKIFDKYF